MRGLRVCLVFLALFFIVMAGLGLEHMEQHPASYEPHVVALPTIAPAPEAPQITGVGVATDTQPWTFWVAGTNFAPQDVLFARLTDSTGAPWTTVWATQGPSYGAGLLRFTLPANDPPSGCGRGHPCTVTLTLFDATTGLGSAPVALTLPDPA